MKKQIAIILFILLSFCSCKLESPTYSFPNKSNQVVSIVFLHNQNAGGEGTQERNFAVIKELSPEERILFFDDVTKIDTHRRYTGPFWGYGDYIARITYDNGDVEMLGSLHIEYIPSGKVATGYGSYCFDHDSFVELLSNYAELPEPVDGIIE